ncbi:MAG TPA: hypothetical protein VL154_12675 [Acetobacteraceae bacterium]|nr:hypothetical protein [Acetobacteraceae bacterium]
MDRSIVYPGSIPLDTDLLNTNRNMMIGLGALMQAVLGSATVVDGLAVGPTVPASLAVVVAPGSITQLATLDAAAYGSLAADTGTPLLKMGINLAPTSFTLTAPVVSGQSVAWLIEASFQESDSAPVVLPYYNAAAPTQPYLGPNNAGTAQNTQRSQRVQLQAKPGAAASTGSQVAPAVDAGWVGLAVVTLAYGQSSVTGASIAPLPAAPVLGFKLPALRPGFAQQAVFSNSGSFVVPAGVRAVKLRIVGAGGYGEGIYGVTPGQSIAVTVGAGGAGGGAGNNAGGTGGTSSFGTFISATGGQGGLSTGSLWSGGAGGTATGGTINAAGSYGSDGGSDITMINGLGGSSVFGGAGRAAKGGLAPANATGPGGGGGGAYGPASAGGAGAPGIVIVEY